MQQNKKIPVLHRARTILWPAPGTMVHRTGLALILLLFCLTGANAKEEAVEEPEIKGPEVEAITPLKEEPDVEKELSPEMSPGLSIHKEQPAKSEVFMNLDIAIPGQGTPDDSLIKPSEELTLDRCIDIALRLHPDLLQYLYITNQKESIVGQKKSYFYPSVDLSGGYTRYGAFVHHEKNSYSNIGANYDDYSGKAGLSQLIYDFGKTLAGVRVARFNLESSVQDLENMKTTVSNNVKTAYYGALQAKKTVDVDKETVHQYTQQLAQARAKYEAGKVPLYDVTKAEVDLSKANLTLIQDQNTLNLAWVKLNNAMGVFAAPEYSIQDNLTYTKFEITMEEALQKAFQNRPDMKALAAQKGAATESIELAKKSYYPAVKGTAAYNTDGSQFPLDQGWNAGVTVTFNVFDGFLKKYQVQEAVATMKTASAKMDSLRQQIVLDVKTAWLNIIQAKESIANTQLQVTLAKQNFDIATQRYQAGVGTPIEVTDAVVNLSTAKLNYINALYTYKTYQANLEKAMGNK